MKLFKIDNGVTYWIAAEDMGSMLSLLREADSEAAKEVDDNGGVTELTEEQGRETACDTQDGRTGVTMWDEFIAATGPTVLACSEY